MRTGATILGAAAFGGIGAGLAAILLSGGHGTGAVGVGTTFLGSFWHGGLLRGVKSGPKWNILRCRPRGWRRIGGSVSNHPCVPSALTLKSEGSTIIKSAGRIGGKL